MSEVVMKISQQATLATGSSTVHQMVMEALVSAPRCFHPLPPPPPPAFSPSYSPHLHNLPPPPPSSALFLCLV